MVDLKYTEKKAQTYKKVQNTVMSMKTGDTIKAAQLTMMVMNDGFTYRLVRDALEAFEQESYVSLNYRDGRIFEVKRL